MFGGGYRGKVANTRRAYDGLAGGNEYPAVIFKGYGKVAANIARYGYTRRDCETIRQFFRMLLAALPVDQNASWDFCRLEWEQFLEFIESAFSCGMNTHKSTRQ